MPELPEWLAYRAAQMGDRVAVLFEDGAWTFRELDRRAAAVACRLSRLGVGPGDRVALLAPNGPAFVELAFGVARLGAVLVPLNVRLSAPELAWQLADARPQLLVFDTETKDLARQALAVLAGQGVAQQAVAASELAGPAPGVQARPAGGEVVELERLFTLMYTSGTTGHPKGVLLTFANHWWSAVASGLNLGVHADDRWLACLPLFHVGGLAILLRSVIYGTTAVVHRRFDEEAVLRALREQGITLLSLVGTMLVRLLQALPQSGRLDSRLRAVLVGGGPVGVQTLERALRAGIPVAQTYGLTEAASQVTTLHPDQALQRLGSAGRPLACTRVCIGQEGRFLPPGEPGEILVRGPTVTPGYWQRPEATRQALRDGWLHTGDVGYLDDEGYLYVLDRREDLVVCGGENIYPAEVEAALLAHPAVEGACVVAVPDALWGQVPVAVVCLACPAQAAGPGQGEGLYEVPELEQELLAFCEGRLARYKRPRRILFAGQLPRNASGKLQRARVREWVQSLAGSAVTGQRAGLARPSEGPLGGSPPL